MADLAIIGMGLMATGGTVAALCASSMLASARVKLRDVRRELDAYKLSARIVNDVYSGRFQSIELTTDDIVKPHVMCGACGLSVPLEADGFTVTVHECHQQELFSHGYGDSVLRS